MLLDRIDNFDIFRPKMNATRESCKPTWKVTAGGPWTLIPSCNQKTIYGSRGLSLRLHRRDACATN
jgi:hypothetical protein